MGKLILVRHGESEGNVLRVFTEAPVTLALTDTGRVQAREAAARIRKRYQPSRVITSHYHRALHTGEIIARELSLPLSVEENLHERDMGELRGRPYGIMREDPSFDVAAHWRWKPAGGESLDEVRARVGPVIDRLASMHPIDELIIVSHGGVMASIWAHVTGRWDDAHIPPNCGIVTVEHESGRYLEPLVVED
jgi:2,3-bisphosphoglycerate-dependent phosphoglycerate mutase